MPSQHRVLFVDDDPAMLSGLSRQLRPLRSELECEFASSGAEALERLAKQPFDIVVSDMRMPGMDGAQLLHTVQRQYPHLIRIVLSGQAEQSAALRAVPVAHQFLAKPCEAKVLRDVLLRAANLHLLLHDRKLKSVVTGVRELPVRPQILNELSGLLDRPNSTADDIAQLVRQDIALSALLLKIVNSAFFGLPRRVTAIGAAISYLGTGMLRALMLSCAATAKLGPRAASLGYDLNAKEQQALLCGQLATRFFDDKLRREDAFTSGLLHDVGELLLVAEGDPDMLSALRVAEQQRRPLNEIEQERGAVTHAHVGAYLLGTWGIPYTIVEAVAHHHDPGAVPHESFDIVDAVYAANLIVEYTSLKDERLLAQARDHCARFADTAEGWKRVLASAEKATGLPISKVAAAGSS